MLTPLDLARNRGQLSVVRMIEVIPCVLAAPQNVIVDVPEGQCYRVDDSCEMVEV